MEISPKRSLFQAGILAKGRPKSATRDRPYQTQVVLSTPDSEEEKAKSSKGHMSINALRTDTALKHTNMADGVQVLRHCYQGRNRSGTAGNSNTGGKRGCLADPQTGTIYLLDNVSTALFRIR